MATESPETNGPQTTVQPHLQKKRRWVKPVLGVAALLTVVVVLRQFFGFTEIINLFDDYVDQIRALGWVGPVIFGGLYVLASVFFLPGSVLTLIGGFLFGVVTGIITVSVGSTVGATAAFLIGRYFARDWVARKIEGNKTFYAIDEGIAREGWKIVGLTRLSPVFPFNLLNYAFGLTRVSIPQYIVLSWVGMLPGALMYVYIGSLAGSLAELGAGEREKSMLEWGMYVIGLLAAVGVTVYITRIARQALKKRM